MSSVFDPEAFDELCWGVLWLGFLFLFLLRLGFWFLFVVSFGRIRIGSILIIATTTATRTATHILKFLKQGLQTEIEMHTRLSAKHNPSRRLDLTPVRTIIVYMDIVGRGGLLSSSGGGCDGKGCVVVGAAVSVAVVGASAFVLAGGGGVAALVVVVFVVVIVVVVHVGFKIGIGIVLKGTSSLSLSLILIQWVLVIWGSIDIHSEILERVIVSFEIMTDAVSSAVSGVRIRVNRVTAGEGWRWGFYGCYGY